MITSQDLQDDADYNDIMLDVKEECAQYGAVVQVVIPRAKSGFPIAAEGFIFVEFQDINGSINAANHLGGRKFAERIVIVSYVSRNSDIFMHALLYYNLFLFFYGI